MCLIVKWSEMPARMRHAIVYAALLAAAIGGHAIKNAVAELPSECRVTTERFPSVKSSHPESSDAALDRLLSDLQEDRN